MDWLQIGLLEAPALERWSPYVVGAGIGVLSWLAFLLSNKPIGCSTAFARTAGMIEGIFARERVREKPYYRLFAPSINWEWMLVVGVIVGAFISAQLSGTWGLRWVPERWVEGFGAVASVRLIVAFVGGVLMGLGARWAGGCTSGHGISGTLQLAVSGWIAVACFFASGTAAAMLIYRILAQQG
jgi:uncharacterized protein